MITAINSTDLTSDTITDEQIRELREQAWAVYAQTCKALGFSPHGGSYAAPEGSRAHRAICAKILNTHGDVFCDVASLVRAA
jgi:hypothetical protein